MISPLLIALMGFAQAPGTMTFDAESVGRLPAIVKSGKDDALWVTGADAGGGSGNHYLVFDAVRADGRGSECVFDTSLFREIDFSARLCISKEGAAPEATGESECGVSVNIDAAHSCRLSIDQIAWTLRIEAIETANNEKNVHVLAIAPLAVKSESWFGLRFQIRGDQISCEVDGQQAIVASGIALRTDTSTLGLFSQTRGIFRVDDIVLKDAAPALSQILHIRGMTCILCEAKIEGALKAVKGVKDARASFAEGTCTVTLDETAPPDIDALVKAVEAAHYQVSLEGA